MFGTCLYLPLSSATANEELPLDLSCKSRECSRPSVFLDLSRRSQQSKEDEITTTNLYRSRFQTSIETKSQSPSTNKDALGCSVEDRTISTESATLSVYDSDSSADSSFHPRKDLAINVARVVTTAESRQPAPKRNRERTLLPCQVCGKAFDRPSLLKRHIRTHTGEKPHVCDVCGKGFSTSSSLNTHRRIHSGEKPHQCPICGKRFTASSNLYYHRMTHVKEKPHKCTMCHKSFPTPGDLKSHMYVHNGSWPFQCHVCKRGFSKQTNLRNHLFLHTGKKPHNCPQCGKCFALACNLRAHMRTHSEPGPFHPATNVDQADNTSVSEDAVTVVKSEPVASAPQKPDENEHCLVPPITPRLADHVFFWHTIQQQLATNIFVQQQQQQTQMNPLHLMSSTLTRPFKFPK